MRAPDALPPIAEPRRTRVDLRHLVGEDPTAAPAAIARRLTDRCWRAWRGCLAPAGMRRAAFAAIVEADRAETWLWVMGDRSWEDLAAGLAGRALRRLAPAGGARAGRRP